MEYLHTTADGYLVYDRHKSHLHKQMVPLIEETIGRITTGGETFLAIQIEFDRVIGYSMCVPTTGDDYIIYAQRRDRVGLTRFVLNRKPVPSTTAVVILKRMEDREKAYVLVSAYVGKKGTGEPWDWAIHNRTEDPIKSQKASAEYWSSHALLWDDDAIIPGSETYHDW